MESYLLGRSQFVQISNTNSDILHTSCGVPQGSVFGLLLFVVYVNDISKNIESSISLFADDIVLSYFSKCPYNLHSVLLSDLKTLQSRADLGSISFNESKTNVVALSSNVSHHPPLQLANYILSEEDSHKQLGLIFHRSLSWHTHVLSLYHKVITWLNVLRKLRLSVPRYTLLILCRSYILPLLDYGDVIYDNISTVDSHRLENLQTTAANFILGCMQTTSHLKILHELSMSPLNLRRNCHILFAFHKILLGPCPTFLATLTPKLFRDLSNHCLRHVMNVQLPLCRTALFHSSFFLKASRLWNSLPSSVQSQEPNLFRSKVTALICGKSHQELHLCGVNREPRPGYVCFV